MLAAKLCTSAMSPMRLMIGLSVILFIFGISFFGTIMRQYRYETLTPLQVNRPYNRTQDAAGGAYLDDPTELLWRLWRPMVHGITEKTYRAADGKDYHLPEGDQIWTEPLGKKVLILDTDSRFAHEAGNLLNQTRLLRSEVEKKTAGRLTHMVYAGIHGYDYRFVRVPDFKDRHGTWTKVPVIREAAREYDVVVFLDADAGFVNMNLPLEWLLNYWKMTKDTSLALAKDPDSEHNQDSKGLVLLNTGFIIAQKNDRTQEILQELEDCPNDERWEGCSKWKFDWAHEQRAFGEYIRYDYNKTTDILALKYPEANGPVGSFVRHDWFKKRDPLEDMQNSFMDMLVTRTHMHFHEQLKHYYTDLGHMQHPLSDVEI